VMGCRLFHVRPAGSMKQTGQRPHKRTPRQLVLRVTLRDIEPAIWRRVRVPDQLTLQQLRRVLQIVFSRLDYHLYEFQIGERRFPVASMPGRSITRSPSPSRGRDLMRAGVRRARTVARWKRRRGAYDRSTIRLAELALVAEPDRAR